jgi:hypothetical protein
MEFSFYPCRAHIGISKLEASMVHIRIGVFICWLLVASVFEVWAQQSASAAATAAVPTLVNFSGILSDENGKALTGVIGVTFSLYRDSQGGAPLWLETQNVTPNKSGHYTVQLGSASGQGLPADLFASGEARWLGVQAQGQAEQPRVMLLSVPYALKAEDATTVGGLPPSAFLLATPSNANPSAATPTTVREVSGSAVPPGSSNVTTTGGTANSIPLFTTATNIQNSILTQAGTTAVNVGGKLNLPATGIATSSKGFNSQPENLVASAFNSGTSTPVPQTFQWQAEPVNNDKTTASGTLNLLFGQGTSIPTETGFKISSKGIMSFAAGQTFPGTGTLTGVFAGVGLSGGGTKGNISLSVSNSGITNAMLQKPALTIAAGTDLTGGGLVPLGGTTTLNLDTAKVPQLNAANTFAGNQTVNGNLTATGLTSNGIGIGTTAPTQSLQIDLGNELIRGTDNFQKSGDTATLFLGDTNNFIQTQFGFGVSVSAFNAPKAFNIVNGGNVGIGTIAPTQSLQIDRGNELVRGTDNFQKSGDTATLFLGDTNNFIQTRFGFGVSVSAFNATNAFNILNGGNVGIGTTAPDNTLTVNGSADKPGGGSWGVFSDRRLKSLNGDFTSGLDQVLKIRPVRYRYKDDNALGIKDREEHIGLVAQEVQRIIPEAVSEDSKGYLVVNNDPILWAILNAVKQQQSLIRKQQHQIMLQQTQIARLTSQVKSMRASYQASGQELQVGTQMAQTRVNH